MSGENEENKDIEVTQISDNKFKSIERKRQPDGSYITEERNYETYETPLRESARDTIAADMIRKIKLAEGKYVAVRETDE
jgi:hypothetical protein